MPGRACHASVVLPRGAHAVLLLRFLISALLMHCVARVALRSALCKALRGSFVVTAAALYAVLRAEALCTLGLCWKLNIQLTLPSQLCNQPSWLLGLVV